VSLMTFTVAVVACTVVLAMPLAAMAYYWGRFEGRTCPHSDLSPIYGDEINHVGGYRLQCRTCARFLDGPVYLAEARAGEPR